MKKEGFCDICQQNNDPPKPAYERVGIRFSNEHGKSPKSVFQGIGDTAELCKQHFLLLQAHLSDFQYLGTSAGPTMRTLREEYEEAMKDGDTSRHVFERGKR